MTPLDAQGNPGQQSESPIIHVGVALDDHAVVDDIADDTELYDPKFTWDPVPGAARYEVEVNSSSDFVVRVEGLLHRQADRHDTDRRGRSS